MTAVSADGRSAKRYVVSRADLSGTEVDIWRTADLDQALDIRDEKAREDGRPPSSVHFRVTDAEDPERGDAERCEHCGVHGSFRGEQGFMCGLCEQEAEEEEGAR